MHPCDPFFTLEGVSYGSLWPCLQGKEALRFFRKKSLIIIVFCYGKLFPHPPQPPSFYYNFNVYNTLYLGGRFFATPMLITSYV